MSSVLGGDVNEGSLSGMGRGSPAALAYRNVDAAVPERAVPLWPALFQASDEDIPFPEFIRELSEGITEKTDDFLDAIIAKAVQRLADRFSKQVAGTKQQISILKRLLARVDVDFDQPLFEQEFVWQDSAEAAVLAIMDALVCAPTRQLLSARSWADDTFSNLDHTAFGLATGLPASDVWAVLWETAIAALEYIQTIDGGAADADCPIIRYRDRWILLRPFSAAHFRALSSELLRPLLAVGVHESSSRDMYIVPFAPSEVFNSSDGIRLDVRLPDETRSISLLYGEEAETTELSIEKGILVGPVARNRVSDDSSVLVVAHRGTRLLLEPVLKRPPGTTRAAARISDDKTHAAASWSPNDLAVATYHITNRKGTLCRLAEQYADRGINIVAATETSVGVNESIALVLSFPRSPGRPTDVVEVMDMDEVVLYQDLTHISKIENPAPKKRGSFWNVSICGPDWRGLMWAVAAVIAHHNGFVRRWSAATRPDSYENCQFSVVTTVELPADADVKALKESFLTLFNEGGDDYEVQIANAPSLLDYWFNVPEESPGVNDATVLTVDGKADVQRIEQVARKLYEQGFNIVGASATTLGDFSTAVLAVSHEMYPNDSELAKETARWLEKTYKVKSRSHAGPGSEGTPHGVNRYDLRVTAQDAPGVLSSTLRAIERIDASVESVYLHVDSRVNPPIAAIRMSVTAQSDAPSEKMRITLEDSERSEGWLSFSLVPHEPSGLWSQQL